MKKNSYSEELSILINKEVSLGDLKGIIYTNGSNSTFQIDIDNKIYRVFTIENEAQKIEEYNISNINIIHLKKLIKKYNFPAWINLPMGDLFALDAPDRRLVFEYDNTKVDGNHNVEYSINLFSRIPKDGMEYINMFIDYILSLNKEKNKIKEQD